ncbi:MAG: hypothetical protein MR286_02645, partial [Clostridiales bacterium]|nr:hypothetical protein [Clostridiales bacterium]
QNGEKSAEIKDGTFYEYSKSGSNYELIELSYTEDFYGEFTARKDATTDGKTMSYTNGKKEIADSADVIVWTRGTGDDANTIDFKHITGKQFKSLIGTGAGKLEISATGDETGKLDSKLLGGFTSDVDGLNRASVLAVKYNSTNGKLSSVFDNISANANYGFITEDAIKLANGNIKFTVWTGTENVEVIAEKSREGDFKKGTIVGYTDIQEKTSPKDETTYVMTDAVAIINGVEAGSITGVNTKGTKIESSTITLPFSDLDDYSTVLYVDSKAGTGMADGKAVKASSQKVNGTTYYATNLLVFGTEVIVIDVKEIAGSRYGAYELPAEIAGLKDVEWKNTRTNDTDEGKAYNGAIMELSFYADKAGTLTLENVVDVENKDNDGSVSLKYQAGANKFSGLIVIGDVSASINGGGTGSQTKNIRIEVESNPYGFNAEDVRATLSNGTLVVQIPHKNGVTDYTVTNTVTVDGVDMGGLGLAVKEPGIKQTWTKKNLVADANSEIVIKFIVTSAKYEGINNAPAGMSVSSSTSGGDTTYTLSGKVAKAQPTDTIDGSTVEDLFTTNADYYKGEDVQYTVITFDRDENLPTGTVSFKQINPGFSKLYKEEQLKKDTANFAVEDGKWVKKHSITNGNLAIFVCEGDTVTLACYDSANNFIGNIVIDGSKLDIQ